LQASGFDRVYDYVGLRFQRVLDVILSFSGLLLLSPLLVLLALLVGATSKGGAIYKQQRVGLNGRLFTLYKFRSMGTDAERDGPVWAQKNDPRVTSVGRFLRASRLDELPQLLNIFKGEMSLIGPRPSDLSLSRSCGNAYRIMIFGIWSPRPDGLGTGDVQLYQFG